MSLDHVRIIIISYKLWRAEVLKNKSRIIWIFIIFNVFNPIGPNNQLLGVDLNSHRLDLCVMKVFNNNPERANNNNIRVHYAVENYCKMYTAI